MSAFLFVISEEAVKKATAEELNALLVKYDAVLSATDRSKLRQCTFQFDQFFGFEASKERVLEEIDNRSKGIDAPAARMSVPGYTPKGGV